MRDDVAQDRQQDAKRVAIAGEGQIAADGVKEPEGRIGRVIQPLFFLFFFF